MASVFRGRARKFVLGHNGTPREITPDDYVVIDCGYETPCWIWKGRRKGRPLVEIRGKKLLAYRVLYERENGPLGPRIILDHLCGETMCVRSTHVEPKTQGEHIRRHGLPGWNHRH